MKNIHEFCQLLWAILRNETIDRHLKNETYQQVVVKIKIHAPTFISLRRDRKDTSLRNASAWQAKNAEAQREKELITTRLLRHLADAPLQAKNTKVILFSFTKSLLLFSFLSPSLGMQQILSMQYVTRW